METQYHKWYSPSLNRDMELAMHPDALNHFSGLSKAEQDSIVEGAKNVSSRDEMRSYVESIEMKG